MLQNPNGFLLFIALIVCAVLVKQMLSRFVRAVPNGNAFAVFMLVLFGIAVLSTSCVRKAGADSFPWPITDIYQDTKGLHVFYQLDKKYSEILVEVQKGISDYTIQIEDYEVPIQYFVRGNETDGITEVFVGLEGELYPIDSHLIER